MRDCDVCVQLPGTLVRLRSIYWLPYIRLQTLTAADPENRYASYRLVTNVTHTRDIPDADLSAPDINVAVIFQVAAGLTAFVRHHPGRKYLWLNEGDPAVWDVAPGNTGLGRGRRRDGNPTDRVTLLVRRNRRLSAPDCLGPFERAFGTHWGPR